MANVSNWDEYLVAKFIADRPNPETLLRELRKALR